MRVGAGFTLLVFWASLFWLSGCILAGEEAVVEAPAAPLESLAVPADANNGTIPILVPPISLWGEARELVLFEGTSEVKECYGLTTQALITFYTTVFSQQATFGCSEHQFPDGVVVPEGTKYLRFEADASGARHVGQWYPWVTTYGRIEYGDGHYDGEGTTDEKHTWRIEMKPKDWDLGTHTKSGFYFGYWTYGNPVNALYGPVKTRVVAERDPKWEPLPVLDHFKLTDKHKFAQDGVITVTDQEVAWKEDAWAAYQLGTGEWPGAIKPKDVIPVGTKEFLVVLQWTKMEGCNSGWTCWVSAAIASGGQWNKIQVDESIRDDGGWKIYRYKVPDEAGEDGPYVKESATRAWPFMYSSCTLNDEAVCNDLFAMNPRSTNLRVIMEAWNAEADLAVLKERLGLK